MLVPRLLLSLGWVAVVGCVWVGAGVGLMLLLRLLLLLWLSLLPELLMLPLATWLLPGWGFWCSSPRGCLVCVRAKLRPARNQRKSA